MTLTPALIQKGYARTQSCGLASPLCQLYAYCAPFLRVRKDKEVEYTFPSAIHLSEAMFGVPSPKDVFMKEGLKTGLLVWKTRVGIRSTLACISPKTKKPVQGHYPLTEAGIVAFAALLPLL